MTDRNDLMARTRAARDYTNRASDDDALELEAFMSIFHPGWAEKHPEKMISMKQDARERRSKRR